MSLEAFFYLGFHAALTIGAVFIFFVRIEHRITRVETKIEDFEKRFKYP